MPITKEMLLNQRGDLSQFLIHLTRTGILKNAKEMYSTEKDVLTKLNAKKDLISIISTKKIEARSAFGYFNYKVPITYSGGRRLNQSSLVKRDWLKAVCFTETPIDHIHLQMSEIYGRRLHFQPYGLGFKEGVIKSVNGNPLFYVHTSNKSICDAFDKLVLNPLALQFKSMMPFVEGFGAPLFPKPGGPSEVDFRWEREWRVASNFSFSESDIAFGLCPTEEIPFFEGLFGGRVPFVDPLGDISQAKQKLRGYPHLKNLK